MKTATDITDLVHLLAKDGVPGLRAFDIAGRFIEIGKELERLSVEIRTAGVPADRAEEIAESLIAIGMGSQAVAAEQERRKAYRDKVADDDGPEAVSERVPSGPGYPAEPEPLTSLGPSGGYPSRGGQE